MANTGGVDSNSSDRDEQNRVFGTPDAWDPWPAPEDDAIPRFLPPSPLVVEQAARPVFVPEQAAQPPRPRPRSRPTRRLGIASGVGLGAALAVVLAIVLVMPRGSSTTSTTAPARAALGDEQAAPSPSATPPPSVPSPTQPARGIPPAGATPPTAPSSPTAPSRAPRGGNPAVPTPQSPTAAGVIPGIVNVTTTLGTQGKAAGTGVVLTPSGEVLTNHHVIQGATSIQVDDLGDGRSYVATVVGYDAAHDIAVLQLKGAANLPTVALGDSSAVAVGDAVTAIGNALGAGVPAVVTGHVTALNQSITATDEGGGNPEQLSGLIETDAPIQPGDSGGPLVDQNGRVIGIDSAGSGRLQVRQRPGRLVESYAVPIGTAMTIVKQIEGGAPSGSVHIGGSGYLGVTVAGVQGTAAASGVVVATVDPGSPAASAGIAGGDVVVSVDKQALASPSALSTAMAGYRPGDRVQVTWLDQAKATHTATVTLAPGPVR